MQKSIFILTLLISTSFVNNRTKTFNTTSDWVLMNLKGHVKSVIEEQCKLMKGSNGNNKICKLKIKTEFNSDGFRIKEQTFEFEQLRDEKKFIYNDSNVLNKVESLSHYYLLKYDSSGYLIEEKIFNNNNQADSKYLYKYDEGGRKIQMDGYNMKTGGNHFIKETFLYDNLGNPIKETKEHATGNSYKVYSYKYDKNGKIIEKTTNISYEKLGKDLNNIRYRYNNENNIIQETEISNGHQTKTLISLDNLGNWIKRTTTESPGTYLTKDRTIEYY